MASARPPFLQLHELSALDEIFLDAIAVIEGLKRKHPVGEHLQRPKLPAALTEGLAAAAVPAIFGAHVVALRPRSGRSDLLAVDALSGHESLVAVKGTGAARWITLTTTDVEANCLLWVDYTNRLADRQSPPQVWVFDQRLEDWARTGRATLRQALAWFGRIPKTVVVSVGTAASGPPSGPSRAAGGAAFSVGGPRDDSQRAGYGSEERLGHAEQPTKTCEAVQ